MTEGIALVSETLSQIDQVTRQNAALVEASAAASESMEVQAQQLQQSVQVFRL